MMASEAVGGRWRGLAGGDPLARAPGGADGPGAVDAFVAAELPELDAQVSVWVLVPRAVISWELQALVNTAYSTTHSTANRVRSGGRSGGSLRDSKNWCELSELVIRGGQRPTPATYIQTHISRNRSGAA